MGKALEILPHKVHIDGLMQDCSNSIANALQLLQSCSKPSYVLLYCQFSTMADGVQGPFLLTWFNFYPSMDK